jgi:hypothetical protein
MVGIGSKFCFTVCVSDTLGAPQYLAFWFPLLLYSCNYVFTLEDFPIGEDWKEVLKTHKDWTNVISTCGRECREQIGESNDSETRALIHENSCPSDQIIYIDGSVVRRMKNGLGFVVLCKGKRVHPEACAFQATTLSMRMEIEAVTTAFRWLSKK